jgi:hypothetical protein
MFVSLKVWPLVCDRYYFYFLLIYSMCTGFKDFTTTFRLALWIETSCSNVGVCQNFGRICCLHIRCRRERRYLWQDMCDDSNWLGEGSIFSPFPRTSFSYNLATYNYTYFYPEHRCSILILKVGT